jgi:long-subunit acyl-CoA synthetase (AMP-forming)
VIHCDRVAHLPVNLILEALQGVIGARAIVTTINIRLIKNEIDYILEHSGAKLIFVDHEYKHLVTDAKARIIICNDTGRAGDPYEDFLTAGRAYSQEKGWPGLEMDSDENKPLSLNYTYVFNPIHSSMFFYPSQRSGTTGRVSFPSRVVQVSDLIFFSSSQRVS